MRIRKVLLIALLLSSFYSVLVANAECTKCLDETPLCFTDEYGVQYCSGILVSIPESFTNTTYTVDARATHIGNEAFAGNEYITHVILPDGIVCIGESAFEGCSSLETIVLPDTLLIIDQYAFAFCSSLSEVVLPSSLYCIGYQAFVDTHSLVSITIPEHVRFIGDEAFSNTRLQHVYVFTTDIHYGHNIFSSIQCNKSMLKVHFLEQVLGEETGNVMLWADSLASQQYIQVLFDQSSDSSIMQVEE